MTPKNYLFTCLLAITALVLAACGSPTVAPTAQPPAATAVPPTPEPTAEPTVEPAPDPLTVVQNYYTAYNKGDSAAVLALLAENVKWRGTPTLAGKASVGAYIEGDIKRGFTVEVSDLRVTANRVTYTWDAYLNNAFQVGGEDTMVVENGLITSIESYAVQGSDIRPEIPVVAFTASDEGFSGPDEIQSGWVKLTLANEGTEPHHIQLVMLSENASPDDLKAALIANPEVFPDWSHPHGGPNAPDPGGTTSAIAFLPAGNYAMIDVIPDATGVPHFVNGFVKALNVTQYNGVNSGEPLPAATFDLADFNFTLSDLPSAGEQYIRFVNKGAQAHEAFIVKLDEGKTADDYLNTPPGEIPPAVSLGGITSIAPGDNQYVSLNLEPGNYALFCFFIDPATHAPHFVQGMVYEFSIE